ncbi:MAG: ParB N-terminal domain-containing protein [Candidatus Bathyarchaeia archaeon]
MPSSSSYTIRHQKLDLEISIAPISKLYLHEEIIPEMLEQLSNEIIVDGVIRHPIIVDKNSFVVLDGMHRVAAAENIGCKKIPVCLVDYFNPNILLGRWFRAIMGIKALNELYEILNKLSLRFDKAKLEEAEKLVTDGTFPAFIAYTDGSIIIKTGVNSIMEAYLMIAAIEKELKNKGFKISYEVESDAIVMLEGKKIDAVLAMPPIKKEDVVKYGLERKLFPHKSTRHVIPARPLGVNVPLELLKRNHSDEEVNTALLKILKSKKLKKFLPGSIIENRRYEEEIYMFV